ncbi:TlpA family protein disulfide reductase [Aquimarina sp. MMG015]|uniref:TlpA family protein disulfide reductase n=1 Tax=Aquimarina TaxID=290174 RepID=UPI000407246F|nr:MULTISPECIES: TlpA disulfide reductase family protein [Aquimarina]AXT56231.1 TlpA family protein disulfide reductase [Aquimarina sp. AD1]MBQ4803673.1 TlpA family protein disulfide reductase [Aquimarina sp. MMG015]RKN19402.1 TlpA family protein disulfide reductase [Aquimarina sp. AD1]
MQKLILYIGLTFLVVGCKGEQRVAFEASNVFSSKGVEIPVYDFENFEHLLTINDGKTRVINFWATWCKPCVAELPYFELINSRYPDKEVEVILVSLDLPNQVETKLIPFVKKQRIQSKIVLLDDPDANTWIPKVNENWSGSIPATIIYKGNTSNFYERSFTYDELERELKKML